MKYLQRDSETERDRERSRLRERDFDLHEMKGVGKR